MIETKRLKIHAATQENPINGAILHSDRGSQYTDEVKAIIFRYVFVYYNRIRIYTSNPDSLPPAAYRRLLEQPLAEAA